MNKKKTFDAVKMMREIRDKTSEETQDTLLQEFQQYIAETLRNFPFKAMNRKGETE